MDLRIGAAPRFLITIDTEGDNLWSMPAAVTTANARFLPRFQTLCESHRLKPTYLTDYQMAHSSDFRAFARAVLDRQTAEIGMHLHAWDTPPVVPLTPNDSVCQPYLIEYPLEAMRDKARFMTDLLEDVFAVKMVSHRAGRWGFNGAYARILVELGYQVDCTVTPHKSWAMQKGNPLGNGGPDYRGFPDRAYFVDLDDISRPGDSALLELPLTIMQPREPIGMQLHRWAARGPRPMRSLVNRLYPPIEQLRPTGNNLQSMLRILRRARHEERDFVEFMIHSSELMPGGSPTFRTEQSIEKLFADLHELFTAAGELGFLGSTLGECAATATATPTAAERAAA